MWLQRFKSVALVASILMAVGATAAATTVLAAGNGAKPVCPGPAADGFSRCHSWILCPQATTLPTGLSPAQILAAYNFSTSSTACSGTTIGIVDAYNDPSAESDLGVFSQKFGLPACTTANGCFKKVNQAGGTKYPRTNSGWALEISLDVQWAHAVATGAHILLVEASSNSFTNLLAAEDYAAAHASYVSNSWGGTESSGETRYDSHFVHSGVSFFVSAGDAGLPAEYPSSSPKVISVGGTP